MNKKNQEELQSGIRRSESSGSVPARKLIEGRGNQ